MAYITFAMRRSDADVHTFGQNETVLKFRIILLFPAIATSNFAAIARTMQLGFILSSAMKTKIGIYLSADVARRFKIAIRRRSATKSDLVNEALRRFFQPPAPEADRSDEVLQLMTKLEKRLRRLRLDVLVMSETLALFVRYSLLVTAPIPESERQAAQALGRKRYEVFIREVAKRVTSDKGMIADVIRTIVRTHPHLVAEALAEARREDAAGGMSHA